MNKTIATLFLVFCLSSAFQLNITQCLQGVTDFSKQMNEVVALAKFEKQTIGKFLNSTFEAFQGLNPLLESCGLDYDFMDTITSYEPMSQEQCFESIVNLVGQSNNIYKHFKSNNFTFEKSNTYMSFAQDLFTEGKVIYKSCWIVNNKKMLSAPFMNLEKMGINIEKVSMNCLLQGTALAQAGYKFVEAAIKKSKPNHDLFAEVAEIYNNATKVLPMCGLNMTLPMIEDIENKKYCVKNFEKIVYLAKDAFYDAKDRNMTEMGQGLIQIFNQTQSMYKTCYANKKPMLAAFNTCFSDNKQLIHDIAALVSDIKEKKDISVTITELYNILKSLQPLVDACGLPIDLHIHLIDITDLQGCIQDIEHLEKSLVSLKNDIQTKKITAIGADAIAIVKEIVAATKQCKTNKLIVE